MNTKMMKNDLKRNPAGNLALVLFIGLSGLLFALSTIILVHLLTAMGAMYQVAQPPHFLQMHKGDLDQDKIDSFNAGFEGLTYSQTISMINLYGQDIEVDGRDQFSLADSRLDISLVKQNPDKDLLVDNKQNKLILKPGQIGIPVILLSTYPIDLGDRIEIRRDNISYHFQVAAFVHDAQMNSTLVSSTRILLSDQDFDQMLGRIGEVEYIIEAYFTDPDLAATYQTAYENAGLANNGPAISYRQIFLISSLGHIMIALIIIMVSLVLILIALLAIKYTLMASLEEEVGEIGIMKAMGMADSDICNLYYPKYQVMIGLGLVVGYLLALGLSGIFTRQINQTFPNSGISSLVLFSPILVCTLIYLLATSYCRFILAKIKKLTVVEALVRAKGFGRSQALPHGLYQNKWLGLNWLLSLRQVFYGFPKFRLVFITCLLIAAIVMVPLNLIFTMKNKNFMADMGIALAHIIIEIDSGKDLNARYQAVKDLVGQDEAVLNVRSLKEVRMETKNRDGDWMNLKVDSGQAAGAGITYLQGHAPMTDQDLAISKLNADQIGKQVGQDLVLKIKGRLEKFRISGIYQDITDGGMTAKALADFPQVEPSTYRVLVWLKDENQAAAKAEAWGQLLNQGIHIQPLEDFSRQTLGLVAAYIELAAVVVIGISLLTLVFVLILFVKLRLVKDGGQIAIMGALGFSRLDIRKQYLYQLGLVAILAISLASILSKHLGPAMVSLVFVAMNLGLSQIRFLLWPWLAYMVIPGLVLSLVLMVVWLRTKEIENYQLISFMEE